MSKKRLFLFQVVMHGRFAYPASNRLSRFWSAVRAEVRQQYKCAEFIQAVKFTCTFGNGEERQASEIKTSF